ncbi:hypothetical protein BGW38_001534 [Lunasporangiospora selenospora]|uniref:Uncharacterized protein n=1 Tax=Lunasporangiospora selenospora TaxID=979761 RepID=A0A9P6FTY8_9FUNG|nr:hypothetical protein BGW38_001534 [Lunasporangiospora selenospora]
MQCLWFVTDEGRIAAKSLADDKRFHIAATALLEKFSVIVTDESFESTVSARAINKAADISEDTEDTEDVEDTDNADDTVVIECADDFRLSQTSDSSGSPSPSLLSSAAKRLQTSAVVSVSHPEQSIVRLGVELNFSVKDLGVREAPSQIEPVDGLLSLLTDSPYEAMLSRSIWIEFPKSQRLPQAWDNLISGCWVEKPILNYATAVLFAGCVIYNPVNRQTALCLVTESYGRGLDIDVHAERPICIGQSVSSVSQPSASGLYPHALLCHIMNDKNDHRLVIGCKTFNILITEVWRVDKYCSSDRGFIAGCCCSAFPIVGNEEARIFIDKRSFDLASDIASGQYIPRFEVDHLRQIRSNLCSEYSYRMGRAPSHFIANMISAQAATIFTLSMISPGTTDTSQASSVMSRIAKEVNAKGREAVLQKALIVDVLKKVRPGLSCHRFLRLILDLFGDKNEIPIIGDGVPADLEEYLCQLAATISNGLYDCNNKVVIPKLRQEVSRLLW